MKKKARGVRVHFDCGRRALEVRVSESIDGEDSKRSGVGVDIDFRRVRGANDFTKR